MVHYNVLGIFHCGTPVTAAWVGVWVYSVRERVEVGVARTEPVEVGGGGTILSVMPGNDPQFSFQLDAGLCTISQIVENSIFSI